MHFDPYNHFLQHCLLISTLGLMHRHAFLICLRPAMWWQPYDMVISQVKCAVNPSMCENGHTVCTGSWRGISLPCRTWRMCTQPFTTVCKSCLPKTAPLSLALFFRYVISDTESGTISKTESISCAEPFAIFAALCVDYDPTINTACVAWQDDAEVLLVQRQAWMSLCILLQHELQVKQHQRRSRCLLGRPMLVAWCIITCVDAWATMRDIIRVNPHKQCWGHGSNTPKQGNTPCRGNEWLLKPKHHWLYICQMVIALVNNSKNASQFMMR